MIATVDSPLIFHSKDFAEVGFTKIDKQNDDDKKTTVESQNIASVHP